MQGGSGNDTYIVESAGDLVSEKLDEGLDLVKSSITYALTGNVENLTLIGGAGADLLSFTEEMYRSELMKGKEISGSVPNFTHVYVRWRMAA